MNTTDAEIAEKLKILPRIANVSVGINPYGSVEVTYGGNFMPFNPSDLLAFCRAVVERVDGDKSNLRACLECGEPVPENELHGGRCEYCLPASVEY